MRVKTITPKQMLVILKDRRQREFWNKMNKILLKTQLQWLKFQEAMENARPKYDLILIDGSHN